MKGILLSLAAAAAVARGAGPGDYRLYVVGDSTAVGEVYGSRLSFPSLAVTALGGSLAGRPLKLVSVAAPGESIHPQAQAFEKALKDRRGGGPGALVLYSGHNDRTYRSTRPWTEALKEDALSRFPWLKELLLRAHRRGLLARRSSLESVERDLRRTIELARERGLTPIVFVPASNLRDVDPGLFEGGSRGPFDRFMRARALEREGRPAEAEFRRALDEGGPDNFGRASGAQLELLRRLAREYGVPCVDAAELFASRSQGRVPGDDLFVDGHHPNLEGTALLADALAGELARLHGQPVVRRFAPPAGRLPPLTIVAATRASLYAGRWFLAVSVRHLEPGLRLDQAERRFGRALALGGDDFSALLGLAAVEAVRRGADAEVLLENIGFYGHAYAVKPGDRPGLLAELAAAGVPGELLRRLERAGR